MRAQRALLETLLRDRAGAALAARDAEHLCAVVLAAIEGAFQLSVSAGEIMPRGYAARTLMALVDDHLAAAAAARRRRS